VTRRATFRGDSRPSWPGWIGPAGFLGGLALSVALAASALAVLRAAGGTADSPVGNLIATVAQDAVFLAIAVGLAALTGPAAVSRLGLRPGPLRASVGYVIGVGVAFYVFLGIYSALVDPGQPQTILEDFGTRQSTGLLIASAVLLVVIAPIAEELFFRGLVYGALRSWIGPVAAALSVSTIFGLLHFTGGGTALIVPPLIMLSLAFCLLYQRTGTLYAPIALHAMNNATAFASQTRSAAGIALGAGCAGLLITGCVAVAHRQARNRTSLASGNDARFPAPSKDPSR